MTISLRSEKPLPILWWRVEALSKPHDHGRRAGAVTECQINHIAVDDGQCQMPGVPYNVTTR